MQFNTIHNGRTIYWSKTHRSRKHFFHYHKEGKGGPLLTTKRGPSTYYKKGVLFIWYLPHTWVQLLCHCGRRGGGNPSNYHRVWCGGRVEGLEHRKRCQRPELGSAMRPGWYNAQCIERTMSTLGSQMELRQINSHVSNVSCCMREWDVA